MLALAIRSRVRSWGSQRACEAGRLCTARTRVLSHRKHWNLCIDTSNTEHSSCQVSAGMRGEKALANEGESSKTLKTIHRCLQYGKCCILTRGRELSQTRLIAVSQCPRPARACFWGSGVSSLAGRNSTHVRQSRPWLTGKSP